ncbi:MAG: UbiX family flavin prenyltransferase [Pseudomonadales bacterium]|uniref:Flavin prenyltransferase UbiX n=1 Tax=Oleiphilus messinensis TaxID=141451 RepID=A0A1Y0IC62_9GAMM|nr:flavin prenyltransferase UbiX [Oleiphilus messinensis]ARU58107.1 phenylacrylic acid decarboxylase [Oleiphilus messinensis]MCG8614001.1 UbiX family flavin prenyltransferase [Pseudomonadales bacterium]
MNQFNRHTVTVAMTGASGAQYGLRLVECLLEEGHTVYFLISKAAQVVLSTETDLKMPGQAAAMEAFLTEYFASDPGQLRVFGKEDWMSPVASGSSSPSHMVICPCSTGTLSAIARGGCDNLIERAADVALKERRKLIIVPRETPYSAIHLENMLALTRMGAIVMPASPGFYHQPKSIDDLVDFIVARILDHLDVQQTLVSRWGESRLT